MLLGNESRTTLAAARSFAASSRPFVVVSDSRPGLVAASRSVRNHVVVPDATRNAEGYIERVIETARATGASLAIPASDATLRSGSLFRDRLSEEGVTFAAASTRAIENVLDKRANLATAERLGIPIPNQFDLQSLDDVPALVEHLGFPLVLKPAGPRPLGGKPGFPHKWLIVRDDNELRNVLATHCDDGDFPLAQELLRGQVVGLYCFAVRGDVVAVHASVAERRTFGQNVLRTIIPVDPVLEGYVRSLLGELEWDGPAGIAFFIAPDGRPSYMETNGRFWGSLNLSIRAGWDFPSWTVDYFTHGIVPSARPIVMGSRGCWRAWDMVGVACVLQGNAWLTDRDHVSGTSAIRDYLLSFRPGIHADVFRLDDPMPELVEHWRLLRPMLGSAAARLGRGLSR
jgi:predicted ATP-grasp superfamily ATP-dependent carboligase